MKDLTKFAMMATILLVAGVVAHAVAQDDLLDLDPAAFDDSSIVIDNPWWPLTPGTKHVYEGHTIEEGEEIEHRIEWTVTDLVKEIAGVKTVVIFEQDFSDGEMIESELAFFAQDMAGNVWHFGQYREEYDEVELIGGRLWLIDMPEGAKAGIMMPSDPQLDTPSYSQGFAPEPFNWTDRAQVYQMGEETCVEEECYTDVLVIEEFNEEEPGAFQLKYYAPGVGNVRVGWRGDDPSKEELELVESMTLSAEELEAVRAMALEMENRGTMYGRTTPVEMRMDMGAGGG